MKKRLFSGFLAIVMLLSLVGTAFAADAGDFSDVKEGQWYYEYVDDVANLGYFVGYPDGTFRPGNDITRAEVVLVLARMAQRLGLAKGVDLDAPVAVAPFADVAADQWYAAAVKWAADEKVTLGVGDNNFAPNSPVTRQDACTLICRFVEYVSEELSTTYADHYNSALIHDFEDEDEIRDYADKAVDACMAYGLVEGFEDHTFQPFGNWTRAQGAKMISVLHDILDVSDEPYVPPYNPPVEEPCTIEDDLEAGKTVTLTEDHTLCRNIVIPAGVTSKLDLNGYTLTIATDKVVDVVSILGSLTFTNGDIIIEKPDKEEAVYMNSGICAEAGGSLELDNVNIYGYRLWNVQNDGTLNLTNAKFYVNGGYGLCNRGSAVVNNCTLIANGEATSQIYSIGGTMKVVASELIEGANFVSYYYHGAIEVHHSEVTLEDVKVTTSADEYSVFAGTDSSVVVKSGTYNTKFLCVGDTTSVTIFGGTINGVAYDSIAADSAIFDGAHFKLTEGKDCWVISQ